MALKEAYLMVGVGGFDNQIKMDQDRSRWIKEYQRISLLFVGMGWGVGGSNQIKADQG